MSEYKIQNAIITKADILTHERGFLDAWIELDYGGLCQGFGWRVLYLPKSYKNHSILSVAGHHIFRMMEIADVGKWSQIVGKSIRVEGSWNSIKRIGHIVKDDWYCPDEDFEKARNELNGNLKTQQL